MNNLLSKPLLTVPQTPDEFPAAIREREAAAAKAAAQVKRNDGLWGSYYDEWSAKMDHIVKGENLDIYLAAIPLIRDWREIFVATHRVACKGARYNSALKQELEKPAGKFRKLTVKEFSELVWLSNDGNDDRLAILVELRAQRAEEDGLRDITTPKAAAKIVREELKRRQAEANGEAQAERDEAAAAGDASDKLAQQLLDEDAKGGNTLKNLMKRADPHRIMALYIEAAVETNRLSEGHAALVRAIEDLRLAVNKQIEDENFDRPEKPQPVWGELGGAFLKPMRTNKLLKRKPA